MNFWKHTLWWLQKKKDFVTLDRDVDDTDFRYGYIDAMIAQIKQEFCNKSLGLQDQCKVIKLIFSRTELNFGSIILIWGSSTW